MSTFGCLIKTAADYAPFLNVMVERDNEIIEGMLTNVRKEKLWEFSLETTTAHAFFAKKSMLNVTGLSPY